jgi:asparagine synthase (glutamine-hydrolysing)
MCGICGVISTDPRQVEPAVRRMMRAMVHRGPDDEGYEQAPVGPGTSAMAGLGFRRLSILDLSPAGHQPMVNPDTGDTLIFNGEIYNFRELRARLAGEGIEVRSSGDTEVLLKALSRWGDKAIELLDGMFAFAFYEARSRRILLARDHVGIKPLYVAQVRGAFVFASEVRAVLASGLVPGDVDPTGIATFLAYGAPQDPFTIHRAIKSFPSGSFCWIDAEAADRDAPLRPTRSWHYPRVDATATEAEELERIRGSLLEALRDQSVADVPVGVFLSGGIDSAIIAAKAKKCMPSLRTHAVGFESDSVTDECQAAAATARALDTTHSQTVIDDARIAMLWRKWLATADRPSIDGLNTFVVSGAVKEAGITVALSGVGADELFGGYPQFCSVPALYRWLRPFVGLPHGLRRAAATALFAPLRQNRRIRAVEIVAGCDSPLDVLLRIRRVFTDGDLAGLGLRSADLGLSRHWLAAEEYGLLARDATSDTFHTISEAEMLLYLGNTVLRDADANSMAHSLEVRVPFLSRRLIECVARLPGSMHLPPGGEQKHLLRKLSRQILPEEVFQRPKTGFSLPIGQWMYGGLRDECDAAIESLAACPALDAAAVRAKWRWFVDNRHRTYWDRPLAMVALGNYLRLAPSFGGV